MTVGKRDVIRVACSGHFGFPFVSLKKQTLDVCDEKSLYYV